MAQSSEAAARPAEVWKEGQVFRRMSAIKRRMSAMVGKILPLLCVNHMPPNKESNITLQISIVLLP